jgi:hypothetical protein
VRHVPDELRQLVKKCLHKQPEERYASISEVKQQLEQVRSFVSGPISGINLKILLRQSRRPRVAGVIALVLIIVGGSVAWWLHRVDKFVGPKRHCLKSLS